jgi:FtsZ-binding cell division protein ZapB
MSRSSTSPFRGIAVRPGGSESIEGVIRSLEQENNSLVEQITVLQVKNKRVTELEDKNEMILRHNTQLLNENERLVKLINQKKSEIEIWKNKHDSVLGNRSTASDLEVKRLLSEIEKLKE